MKLIVSILVVIAAVYWWVREPMPSGEELVIEGAGLRIQSDHLLSEFHPGEPFRETYMLFGGIIQRMQGNPGVGQIAGLPLPEARRISRRYPDFHLCASAGASEARDLVQDMHPVPGSRRVFDVLDDAMEQSSANIRSGGDRVCLAVSGRKLRLSSTRIDGEEVTMPALFTRQKFVLIEEADYFSCDDVLY
jgi:hypothetical protein